MRTKLLLFAILILLPLSGRAGDNSIAGAKYDPSNRSQVPYRTTDDGSGNQIPHVIVDSGAGGGGAMTVADGANVTQGAKADAKSTATDTTPVTIVSILKQISASVQAPPSQAVTGPLTDTQLRATAVPVSQSGTFTVQPGNTANTTAWNVAAATKQLTGVPSSFTIQTADQTVFTLAAGEVGFIQNLSADAPMAVKYGSGASTTSLNYVMPVGTAASDGKGGVYKIDDWVGVVSVAKMTGTASYLAWKRAP